MQRDEPSTKRAVHEEVSEEPNRVEAASAHWRGGVKTQRRSGAQWSTNEAVASTTAGSRNSMANTSGPNMVQVKLVMHRKNLPSPNTPKELESAKRETREASEKPPYNFRGPRARCVAAFAI